MPFTDEKGHTVLKPQFLHQLGPACSPARLCPTVPHVEIGEDTHRLAFSASSATTEKSIFTQISECPSACIRRWVERHAKTKIMDLCGRPSCRVMGEDEVVPQVFRIPKASLLEVLKCSGTERVFVRLMHEDTEKEKLKVVLLRQDIDLVGAMRCAGRLQCHLGV